MAKRSATDLLPDLEGLDAIDLAYLISSCRLPAAFRNWGERAEAAERRALDCISDLVPGGHREGYRVDHYAWAARVTWDRKGYTFERILS